MYVSLHSRIVPALLLSAFLAVSANGAVSAYAQEAPMRERPSADAAAGQPRREMAPSPAAPDSITEGSVTVGGQAIAYKAIAGTITVGASPQQDAALGFDGKYLPDSGMNAADGLPTARMFYVAYFKKDAAAEHRPVTFIYNGGPGSPTMWLHLGTFAPKRIASLDAQHQEGAPYTLVPNEYSLLDVSDVVFIDAPGCGLSRTFGKGRGEAFYGIDADGRAFERFIRRFISKYNRWNSPKYIFGESYGTPRTAVLAADLTSVDVNGIILLSQILSFDNSADGPKTNPGVDQPYALALPTYAATAFYYHKLPVQPPALKPFLAEVEKFALGPYMSAMLQGSELSDADKRAIAEKLHSYTGLSVQYLMEADLRVDGGEFSEQLKRSEGITTGRVDTRYEGPSLDPVADGTGYDPQTTSTTPAWNAIINTYLHNDLKYATQDTYFMSAREGGEFSWNSTHRAPGGGGYGGGGALAPGTVRTGANVMGDLAYRMKLNPKMKVMLAGGYFDLATPYFEGVYEMHHLPMPNSLQSNISYHYYESGHMIYVTESVLKQFHADVAAFIKATEDGRH